ncbi:MAG: biotin synthase BioB, partial [Plesiomonas shigelloides]
KVAGTPLAEVDDLDPFEFIRTIAVARIMMPRSHVRFSAGREKMNEQMQALCFMAGANSVFYGCKLLTTPNPAEDKDRQLFQRLGINTQTVQTAQGTAAQADELAEALLQQNMQQDMQQENALFYNAAL